MVLWMVKALGVEGIEVVKGRETLHEEKVKNRPVTTERGAVT
jgi:hypothetical protein